MRVFDPQWLYDRFAFWYAVVDAVDAALPSMLSLTRFGTDNQQTTTFIEADADSSFNMLNWVIGGSGTSSAAEAIPALLNSLVEDHIIDKAEVIVKDLYLAYLAAVRKAALPSLSLRSVQPDRSQLYPNQDNSSSPL
ncbi:Uncharacterized protein HZ326_18994 [Fusarium oxysporum f. sp. albedinis]|nr:Uncharacterized protein HZ326_18994 [Fusarium oxysporum f. sp. albedinis]